MGHIGGALTDGDLLEHAIELFVGIVTEIEASGEICLLSRVSETMMRRDPSLRCQDLGFASFQRFAEEVERRGLVRLTTKGTIVTVSAKEPPRAPCAPETREEAAERLCRVYRQVLEGKRVPQVPWRDRRRLIEALWQKLAEAPHGLTIREMSEAMEQAALAMGINVSQQAIYKMTYTLNLGRCFMVDQTPRFVEDVFGQAVKPVCEVEQAEARMHVTYVRGIMLDRPDLPLVPEAIARLLFDSPNETQLILAREYIRRAETWRD